MRLRLGRPRVALIVAPHPDDEVIGAAHLMAALRRRGTRVRVLIVTDGAASHAARPGWPRQRLISERKRESRRMLRRLGVTAGAIRTLDAPDGNAANAPLRRQLGRELARLRQLDLIVAPARDDAHPDHRAVATALETLAGGWRRLSYRVWPPHRSTGGRGLALPGRGGHAAKASLVRGYRTQMGAIRDDPGGFSIAPHELAVFAHPIERFVEVRR